MAVAVLLIPAHQAAAETILNLCAEAYRCFEVTVTEQPPHYDFL
jgi:hypothetical protein